MDMIKITRSLYYNNNCDQTTQRAFKFIFMIFNRDHKK